MSKPRSHTIEEIEASIRLMDATNARWYREHGRPYQSRTPATPDVRAQAGQPRRPSPREVATVMEAASAEQMLKAVSTCKHEASHALVCTLLLGDVIEAAVTHNIQRGYLRYDSTSISPEDNAATCWAGVIGACDSPASADARTLAARLSESDRHPLIMLAYHRDPEHFRLFGHQRPDDVLSGISLEAFARAQKIIVKQRPALLALMAHLRHRGVTAGVLTGDEVRALIRTHVR